jgi:molecular chaperone GrpE (heat shock protein)
MVAKGLANQAKPVGTDSSTAPVVTDTVIVQSKSRDEQIASLKDQLAKSKDELAKANAELERIKKRLANPSN